MGNDDLEGLKGIINNIGAGITVSDENGHFEIFNPKMGEITGYTAEEANRQDFSTLIYPDLKERRLALEGIGEVKQGGGPREVETIIQAKDGSTKTLLVSTSMIFYKNRRMFLSAYRDITERKTTEEKLHITNQVLMLYDRLISFTGIGIYKYTFDEGRVVFANQAFVDILCFGCNPQDLVGKVLDEIITCSSEIKILFKSPVKNEIRNFECRFKTLKGHDRWVIYNSFVLTDSRTGKKIVEATMEDITMRKRAEEEREVLGGKLIQANRKLRDLALRDSHTGLYNHRYLATFIEAEFSRSRRQSQPLSVIMMDIDYFKAINDVYGHRFGDLILKQLSGKIGGLVRQYDAVARYGGEEFVVVSPGTGYEGIIGLSGRILSEINSSYFGHEKNRIQIKISLGVAAYPADGAISRGMDLMALADKALNKAKEEGGNRVCSFSDIGKKEAHLLEKESGNVEMLKKKIERLSRRVNQSLIEQIFAFAKNVEMKDHYTGEHVERCAEYAGEIARRMGFPAKELEAVKQAAILHDLGKIGVSEKVLLKPSRLTQDEFEEIKKHPQIGADILKSIYPMHDIVPFVMHHHERWDGKGYPFGLRGAEIPLGARIISIADAYHALSSDRSYRRAYSVDTSKAIIKEAAGTQFDPEVVTVFLSVLEPPPHPGGGGGQIF